jgi:hypothetical protein
MVKPPKKEKLAVSKVIEGGGACSLFLKKTAKGK